MGTAKKVVIGWNSSIDGFLAAWIARNLLPDWRGAELLFAKSDEEADELDKDPDTLVLNVGGGQFSGHPHDKYPVDCAATLLAKHYKIQDNPRISRLLKLALVSDKAPVGDMLKRMSIEDRQDASVLLEASVPVVIKKLYAVGFKPEDAYKFAEAAFYAEYISQKRFHDEAVPQFEKEALKVRVGEGGRAFSIAAIRSDNDQIQKVAQSKYGGRQQLLFQMHSSGNWAIFGFHGFPVAQIVAVLRCGEMIALGQDVRELYPQALEADGSVAIVPDIFYHHNGEQIFNGSLTHPNVPPTKIGFERIWQLVQIALNPRDRKEFWDRARRARPVC